MDIPVFDAREMGVVPAREERSDAARHRREVLAVTRALVEAEGVEAVTVRRVAERCGLGVGTLYRRFPSKASLLAALVVDGVQALEARLHGHRAAVVGGRCLPWFVSEARQVLTEQAVLLGSGAQARPILTWIEETIVALLVLEDRTAPAAARRIARVLTQLLQPAYLRGIPPEDAAEELDMVLIALRMSLR